MYSKSYAVFAALLVLAVASLAHGMGYRHIELLDSVSITKGDWNAVCYVRTPDTILWVVGDSGNVRRYDVVKYQGGSASTKLMKDFSLGGNYTLCDVCFPSQQYGYIVGYEQREVGDSGVIVPGKGKIWRSHNYGTSWDTVDLSNIDIFNQSNINVPCLSVDFYNDQYGYVGCGCGYVLYSNDWGQTWYALGDTLLPKKPPWDSVAWAIGSIPRDMPPGSHYYNHFGDWLTEWISLLESNND